MSSWNTSTVIAACATGAAAAVLALNWQKALSQGRDDADYDEEEWAQPAPSRRKKKPDSA